MGIVRSMDGKIKFYGVAPEVNVRANLFIDLLRRPKVLEPNGHVEQDWMLFNGKDWEDAQDKAVKFLSGHSRLSTQHTYRGISFGEASLRINVAFGAATGAARMAEAEEVIFTVTSKTADRIRDATRSDTSGNGFQADMLLRLGVILTSIPDLGVVHFARNRVRPWVRGYGLEGEHADKLVVYSVATQDAA